MSVRRVTVPEPSFGAMDRVDYGDCFVLTTDVAATPERWARALFGDNATPGERFIWGGLLGLQLRDGLSPDTVAGWRIDGRGGQWLRMATASWFLQANLVVTTSDGAVSLTTLIGYRKAVGRLWWPPLSVLHRRLVPLLFGRAEALARRPREG